MYVWLVNQAAREFQLWCRHESDFRAVSANSDSNHPKFSKQNDTDGSMSIKQGHCSVKKGKQWRIEQVSIPSKWSTCTAMVLDAPGLKNCLAGAQSRALGVPGRPGTQPKPSHWNLGTMAQLIALFCISFTLLYHSNDLVLYSLYCCFEKNRMIRSWIWRNGAKIPISRASLLPYYFVNIELILHIFLFGFTSPMT
jgi:hypothetical protein